MLEKKKRIKLKKDFQIIFKTGQSYYGRFVGVKIKKNEKNNNRFAILISKKVEKKAVKRNKIKRMIKKFILEKEKNFSNYHDCVIIVLSLSDNKKILLDELNKIFKKIDL